MSDIPSNASKVDADHDAVLRGHEKLWDSIWNILTSYLQDDSKLSLDDAVEQVNQRWDDTTIYMVAALTVPISIAKQTPYDHATHKKLAEFMLALDSKRSESHPPLTKGCDSLGNFGVYLWDSHERPDTLVDDVEDPEDPIVYANFCAFLANLIFSNGKFHHYLAKYALEDATKVDGTAPVEVRDAWIIGAAQFIIYQVPTIFEEVSKDRRRGEELAQPRGCLTRLRFRKRQPRHDPEAVFLWDDWQAWRRTFGSVAVDETYGKTCRDIAQKAADLMALQEKIEDDHVTKV